MRPAAGCEMIQRGTTNQRVRFTISFRLLPSVFCLPPMLPPSPSLPASPDAARRWWLPAAVGVLLTALAAAGLHRAQAQPRTPSGIDEPRGIPGARNVDHVGLTVPDLDQALKFFVDVLGADVLWTDGPTSDPTGDSMTRKLGVDPHASMRLAMLRCGPNLNVELLEYHAPGQNTRMPANSDVDSPHLAFYVDDVDRAGAYLQAHGCRLLGGPNTTPANNPRSGQMMRYATTPWGFTVELVHRPDHMPYEKSTEARLYGPAPAWK